MTAGTRARATRDRERGLTLIELLVTIAVLALGFVAIVTAFTQTETQVGVTSDEAQLVSRARQISDLIQSESFAYVQCATPSTYQTPLRASSVMTSLDQVLDVEQAQSSSSYLTVAGTRTALTPINSCLGGSPDFGVQRIKFEVFSGTGRTLSRVVYKRWN